MIEAIWAGIGGLTGLLMKENKPNQLALAVALGVMIGLLPKANLLALSLILILFLIRANLGVGILVAALVTFAGPYIDPYADQLGTRLLENEGVRNFEAKLYQLPFFAWASLNNTVVLGQFLFGLIAFWPVYAVTYGIFRIMAPKKKRKFSKKPQQSNTPFTKSQIGSTPQRR